MLMWSCMLRCNLFIHQSLRSWESYINSIMSSRLQGNILDTFALASQPYLSHSKAGRQAGYPCRTTQIHILTRTPEVMKTRPHSVWKSIDQSFFKLSDFWRKWWTLDWVCSFAYCPSFFTSRPVLKTDSLEEANHLIFTFPNAYHSLKPLLVIFYDSAGHFSKEKESK